VNLAGATISGCFGGLNRLDENLIFMNASRKERDAPKDANSLGKVAEIRLKVLENITAIENLVFLRHR
jgi:hypothetical protein